MRDGQDIFLPREKYKDDESGRDYEAHTLSRVCCEMILQIAADYPGIPDVRTLSIDDILFFYEGGRKELQRRTKST